MVLGYISCFQTIIQHKLFKYDPSLECAIVRHSSRICKYYISTLYNNCSLHAIKQKYGPVRANENAGNIACNKNEYYYFSDLIGWSKASLQTYSKVYIKLQKFNTRDCTI